MIIVFDRDEDAWFAQLINEGLEPREAALDEWNLLAGDQIIEIDRIETLIETFEDSFRCMKFEGGVMLTLEGEVSAWQPIDELPDFMYELMERYTEDHASYI